MKRILTGSLILVMLILSACGAATGDDTTADEYRAEAEASVNESLDDGEEAVIYEYSTISSDEVIFSYYVTPVESTVAVYEQLNSFESKSTYEITDEIDEVSTSISSDEDLYLEFMIAYTVNESDAEAENRFKTAELEEVYDRSTVKVDRDFEFDTTKFEYMADLSSVSNFAIKRSGRVFTLYLDGDAVKTLSLTKDIQEAYLVSYRYYEAKIDEVYEVY